MLPRTVSLPNGVNGSVTYCAVGDERAVEVSTESADATYAVGTGLVVSRGNPSPATLVAVEAACVECLNLWNES